MGVAVIHPRSAWGARKPKRVQRIPLPTPKLYLHHSAGSGADEEAVKAIQDYHMDVKGWSDIGYNFLVDNDAPDIDIFEGRGPGVAGGHTAGQNTVSHGICVIGNFTKVPPEPETLEAIAVLVAHGHLAGWWPDRITGGHRDAPGAATSCPGDALYRLIPSINRRVKELLEEPMKVIAGFKWLDYETWPEYAKPSIIKNIEAGVIRGRDVKGKPDSKLFDPNSPLSRAEAAVLLDRIGAVR